MKMGRIASLSCALVCISSVAYGHEGAGIAGGFVSGFAHPILG